VILWHTEIEQRAQMEVASLLGLTANAVSALAYRAREGLRRAYLQVHLAEVCATTPRCHAPVDQLGSWTRGGLSKRERLRVQTHLDSCERCRCRASHLRHINDTLRRAA